MKYYQTKFEAEIVARENGYLLGQPMPSPYKALNITSITVEKASHHQGFYVVLSHDIFDGGWPELTGFKCPQIELEEYYLAIAPSFYGNRPKFL